MNSRSSLYCAVGLLIFAAPILAQDPDYTLSIQPPEQFGFIGLPTAVSAVLDFPAGTELAGWSWGMCHTGGTSIVDIQSISDGATTVTVNGGAPPAFNAPAILSGEGWTIGVVINFFGDNPLQPGSGYELHVAQYSILGPGVSDLSYCSTLGMPLVATTLVDSAGGSVVPTTESATIGGTDPDGPFFFFAPVGSAFIDGVTGVGFFGGDVSIGEKPFGPGGSMNTQGFSMGLAHDGAVLTATGIEPQQALSDLNGGAGPDFFGPNIAPSPGPGITLGVVYNFLGGVFLQFGDLSSPTPVVTLSYNISVDPGSMFPVVTELTWSDSLGTPSVENTVVVDGGSAGVFFEDGQIFIPGGDPTFVRGNCNDDGIVDIADGIWILNELFQGGPSGPCFEACDANDDDSYDQSDAVYIFNYRFLDGPEPPAPFPGCGTVQDADCDSGSICP